MKFESPLQLRNKVLQLGDNQLFGFIHWDGFNKRQLTIEMMVDKEYDYELYIKSAELLTNSKVHYDNRYFEFTVKGHLPVEIEDLVEELVLTKRLSRLLSSPPPSMEEGLPEQQYLLRSGTEQVEVLMPQLFAEDDFTSPTEKAFLNLHKLLQAWTERTYAFLSSNS